MRHWKNATSTQAGILRTDEFAAYADVERVACASALSPWVENYWCLRWDLPSGTTYVSWTLPHPACNLSIEHGPPRREVGGRSTRGDRGDHQTLRRTARRLWLGAGGEVPPRRTGCVRPARRA
ncbi:MAG: DUF6597 domain-containing transcriptional factor [Ilumatobacteraceae bacterium]